MATGFGMELIELARKLMDIPSVSGDEAGVGRFLSSYLTDLGYRVETIEVSAGRANILATTAAAPLVVLSTHMDTVPPHIASTEDEQYVWGRGACDAKGIIASQVVAAEQLRAEGVSTLGLLFTVDEELGSLGARRANLHPLASSCRYLVNGEPTENRLAVGSKGSLRLRLETKGRAAHSAYPEHGSSAIEKLLDVLSGLRACQWPVDDFFGETTCNIGVINGGMRPNVIPAEAQAELQFRLVSDAAQVQEMIERVVAGRAAIEYLSVAEPVRLHAVAGFEQSIVRFTTDIPYLSRWGTALLLGPGSILDAHTADERVAKAQLREAVELYRRLVRFLLTQTDS